MESDRGVLLSRSNRLTSPSKISYHAGMKATNAPLFTLPFAVRDYECDMEGIVNNAVYQNYLEHARHEFLRSQGLDFSEITRRGLHPVVVRAEIDYKRPLRSGDQFDVTVALERVSPLRFAFIQKVLRRPDGELIVEARIIAAVMDSSGRPVRPDALHENFTAMMVTAPDEGRDGSAPAGGD
jgi:acyl-CoA thioester hydrolase